MTTKGVVFTSHADFQKLTRQRYRAMQQRLGPLPFPLEHYRQRVIDILGGEQGVARCEYCNAVVSLLTLELDHRMPPFRGGSLGFDNLAPCCSGCNQQKGEMSALAFMGLLMLVNNDDKLRQAGVPQFEEIDRTNLLGRLQSEFKLALLRQKDFARQNQSVRLNPMGRIRYPEAG